MNEDEKWWPAEIETIYWKCSKKKVNLADITCQASPLKCHHMEIIMNLK